MMRRGREPGDPYTCDDHPGQAFTGQEAWDHLQSEHPDHAATAGRLVQAIGKANQPAPGRRGKGQRKGHKRPRR